MNLNLRDQSHTIGFDYGSYQSFDIFLEIDIYLM